MKPGATALVLSGGGAFAAYEVGVVRALVEGIVAAQGKPVIPGVVTGTSAGAFNAALIASRTHLPPAEALAEVERVWLDEVSSGICGNGVFRWRGSPFNFLDWRCLLSNPLRFFWERMEDVSSIADITGRWAMALAGRPQEEDEEQRFLEVANLSSFISTHPFPRLVRRTVDFEALRRCPVQVRVLATDWNTGELRVFGNEDLTESRGPLIVMASSSIPGLFSPVYIPPRWLVDGGVLMNTPLSPAISAGATELHVVYLDPEIRRIPLRHRETTLGTFQRTLAIAMAGIMRRDVEVAQRINRGLQIYHRYQQGDLPEDAGEMYQVLEQVESHLRTQRPYRLLTIHRYHPRELLGGPLGMLRFEREFAGALMERGYRDGLEHDCDHSGCVIPSPEALAAEASSQGMAHAH